MSQENPDNLPPSPSPSSGQPYGQVPGASSMPPGPMQYQAAAPQQKSHTLRNVLIAVGIILVLLVGGCAVIFAMAGNEIVKSVNEEVSKASQSINSTNGTGEVGGPNNAVTIVPGKGFDIRGFKYSDGWSVADEFDGVTIKNLKVTNNRGKPDSALVDIKFMKGNEVLESVDCTTSPIQPGQMVTLSCMGTTKKPTGYDKITINDTF